MLLEKLVLNFPFPPSCPHYDLYGYACDYSSSGDWLPISNLSAIDSSAADNQEFALRGQLFDRRLRSFCVNRADPSDR